MELIYTDTRKPVAVGDTVKTFRGDTVTVTYFSKPHKPESQGKISVRHDGEANDSEYYVGVIGAEWINREDRSES